MPDFMKWIVFGALVAGLAAAFVALFHFVCTIIDMRRPGAPKRDPLFGPFLFGPSPLSESGRSHLTKAILWMFLAGLLITPARSMH